MTPYDVREDETRGVVVVTIAGRYDGGEVFAAVGRARALAAARGHNILYDVRAAIPGAMGAGELFWMPRTMPELRDPDASRVRVALLYPPAHQALAEFWETTFLNAGLQVRIFTEEPAALAWLAG